MNIVGCVETIGVDRSPKCQFFSIVGRGVIILYEKREGDPLEILQ